MITIGIITNADRDREFAYTKMLAESITKRGGKALLTDDLCDKTGVGQGCGNENDLFDNSRLVVCLGGDGTFLKVARKVYRKELPILGINLGNLGFLTEIERNDADTAIAQIFNGEYTVEKRMMLEATIHRKNEAAAHDIALNDVVVSRGAISRIVHIKTYINDIFVDIFPGDGLIVSSPTGSTAYSLSAGGPIVEPDTNLMVVTPICPHILYSRSFVTKAESEVKALVDEDFHHNATVTFDGQKGYEIRGGDWVTVRNSPYSTKLIRMNTRNFFNILRTKIYYRGESLKKNEI